MKKLILAICILLLSFFSVKPLLSSGYFPMHDDTQVARVVVMGKALKAGQFPVRWVSDLGYGYGYPIFNFYGPLPYYIGGGLYALGVDSVVATKTMFALGMLLAPITMFILVSSTFGSLAAVSASMLFLYAPYHAIEVYIRGSVGEYYAIAFVPLLLYGFKQVLEREKKSKGIIIGSVALACIITSHTILGFVTCLFIGSGLIIFWTVQIIQKKLQIKSVVQPLLMVLFGLALSAFFWLPAIFEMSATSVRLMIENATTTFFDHFVCIGQLWNSPWGYAGSAPGCVDGMSFKLGKAQVIVFLSSLVTWLFLLKKQEYKKRNTYMTLGVIGALVCIFLSLQYSSFIWKIIPFTSFIQYPWRLLAYSMFFVALGGAYVVSVPRMPIVRIGLMIGIVTLTLVVNAKIFVPQYTYVRDSYAFETVEELRFTKSKISDEYLPYGIVKPVTASTIVKTAIPENELFTVRSIKETDTSLVAELETSAPQRITIQKAWFPGWHIRIDGHEVQPIVVAGLPTVNIPKGMSIIHMQLTDTPVRTIGNIISICAGIILGALYIYGKKTNA